MSEKIVYVMRVRRYQREQPYWVMMDKAHTLTGKPKHTRSKMYAIWRDKIGPFDKIVRYDGTMRLSESIATIVSIQEGTEHVKHIQA